MSETKQSDKGYIDVQESNVWVRLRRCQTCVEPGVKFSRQCNRSHPSQRQVPHASPHLARGTLQHEPQRRWTRAC
ncbi:uncharacterized protein BJ212DRAFT_1373163 [Suillus subaureus]|uniref:Uncharacterized protein n=1 Tax=Suillus subaureus TaxID=48587 RepID=A0A9P7E639_9AGAM|nr:uncharacterized protein BJ212DRAFT_1373163 [Suillus subaureus]KAG1811801.1 hypothetical protein BJ212DRAFT_1373163 [Suillus subaureus]